MSSQFATYLKAFLQLYLRDPDGLFGSLDGAAQGASAWLKDEQEVEQTIKVRLEALKEALEKSSLLRFETNNSTQDPQFQINENTKTLTLDELKAKYLNRTFVANLSEPEPGDLLSNKMDGSEFLLTWHYASKLEDMAIKLTSFDDLVISDIVSSSVRTLLQEAHFCFLQGLEAASAITAGAALEETLREVLGISKDQERKQLCQLLKEAKKRSILIDEDDWKMANAVRESRNFAAHNPKEFLRGSQLQKIGILDNARKVIEKLYSHKKKTP